MLLDVSFFYVFFLKFLFRIANCRFVLRITTYHREIVIAMIVSKTQHVDLTKKCRIFPLIFRKLNISERNIPCKSCRVLSDALNKNISVTLTSAIKIT